MTSTNLSHVYFPSRGVVWSLLFHAVFFTVLIMHRVSHPDGLLAAQPREKPKEKPDIIFIEPKNVLWLPALGGGSAGGGGGGKGAMLLPGGSSGGSKGPTAKAAPAKKGLAYPGPQKILSDPPEPTNTIQTLLQPGLDKPPVLTPPLPLPNFVQMASASPEPKVESPQFIPEPPQEAVKPPDAPLFEPPPFEPQVDAAVTLPPLPVGVDRPPEPEIPTVILPPPGPPPPPDILKRKPAAKQAAAKPERTRTTIDGPEDKTKQAGAKETAPLAMRGSDPRSVLSLSPMPAVQDRGVEIPVGEMRGRFAISPEGSLEPKSAEPGSKIDAPPSKDAHALGTALDGSGAGPAGANGGTGAGAGAPSGSGSGTGSGTGAGSATGPGSGTGTGSGSGVGPGTGSGKGTGSGPGTGTGTGPGSGSGTGSGSGSGSGSATGPGSGTGPGTGTGSGSGAGSGAGRAPFAGITVVGGVGPVGSAANSSSRVRPAPRPLRSSYGVTVISTESSGGGLPFSGVFGSDPVYTAYLDMRRTEYDADPSWTLEFSVMQGAGAQASPVESMAQQGVVLPYPRVKEQPALPAEVVRKYLRKMVIVFALVSAEGKLEEITIKDSPDPLLNQPVLDALARWIFRPARLNGEPVRAKVLMGIPLWLP